MKFLKLFLCLFMIISCVACTSENESKVIDERPKVILDCDMAYFSDDAMALSLLLQAEKQDLINLMGISIVGGNTFVAEGTNTTLRQLELFERTDIPVYQGEDIPLDGFLKNLKNQNITDAWGAINKTMFYIPPEKWNDLGQIFLNRKYGYASIKPQEKSAVDFLVESVQQYPKEITIFAIGPALNIAKAIEKDPTFAENVKEIIYMDGNAYVRGNITPYAEYNVFYDPKAFDICIHSNFPSQVLVPNDISHVLSFDKAAYETMMAKPETPISLAWSQYSYKNLFAQSIETISSIWDVATVLYYLKPELFTQIETHGFEVNCDRESERYGETVLTDDGNIKVLLDVDAEKTWDYYTDMLTLSNNEDTKVMYSTYREKLNQEIQDAKNTVLLQGHNEVVIDGQPRNKKVDYSIEYQGVKDFSINSYTYDVLENGDYVLVLDIDINQEVNYFSCFSKEVLWGYENPELGNYTITFVIKPEQLRNEPKNLAFNLYISDNNRAFIFAKIK